MTTDKQAEIEHSREFVESLRKMADFFAARPELKIPYVSDIYAFVYTKDELVAVARQLGSCEKGASDSFFYLKKTFGCIQVTWNLNRSQACRKVITGKKLVPEQRIEAVPEKVIPAHEEDLYEWHCDEPLLAGGKTEGDVVQELLNEATTAAGLQAATATATTDDDIPF